MPVITQHRPAYFEGYDNEEVEFETLEELYNIPFVKNFTIDEENQLKFEKFSLSRASARYNCYRLMAEYDQGYTWWVVGILKEDIPEIPDWQARRKELDE